jgi:TonB-linked SusC/RagA family outer membrane protein
MKSKIYTWLVGLILLLGSQTAWAQRITGTVADEEGQAIPGVSVLVKGTTRGTITDLDGKFELAASKGETIIFSLVGYAQQAVAVTEGVGVMTITMSGGNIKMDEVVVGALNISGEKRKNGFASQKVDGEDLAATNRDNFLESLQSRVAGLNVTSTGGSPGASSLIVLRNATSFSQDNQPLFVIDGVPINNSTFNQGALVSDGPNRNQDYSNPASDINPNDIESINVLKGAEAAALYGFYGANGAIIITTKKGRSGPGKFTYNNNFGFSEVYRFPEVQTTYQRGSNGLNDPIYRRHFGSPYPAGTQLYDNIGNFFETGATATHNIGFEGGNDRTTYRFSGAYLDNKGVVPTTRLQRYNFRVSGSSKITDKLEVSSALNVVKSKNIKAARGVNGLFLNLLVFPKDVDARNYLNPNGTRIRLTNFTAAAGSAASESDFDNPYFDVNKNKASDLTDRAYGNINISYNPTTWLNFTGNTGYDFSVTEGNFFTHPESNRGLGSRGEVENYNRNSRVLNGTGFARVKQDFGKLNASLRVGGAIDEQRYNTVSLRGQRLIVPELNSLNNTDITTQRTKQTFSVRRSVGVFADVSLDYGRFLTLNASIRNDRTSTLNPPNNSFIYPGANVSFVFSELLKIKNFDFGKVRFGLAGSGRDVPPYNIKSDLAPQVTTGGGYALGFTGNSPDLQPEIIRSYSAGLELNFFKNRLGLDFTYYDQINDNQIMRLIRLSYGTGYVLQNFNGGKLSSNGVEAIVTVVPVRTKEFEWSTLFNFAKGQTKVVAFPKNVPEFYVSDTWLFGNARASVFPDGNATTIGGYTYARNNKGDLVISGTTGLPTVDQNFKKIGDRQPDFMLGIVNKFKYKNLSFSFALDIRKGGDIYNGNALYLSIFGLHPNQSNREEPVIINGVLNDGKENSDNPTKNTIQLVPYTSNEYYRTAYAEENFIEKDINWLRLKDARISYYLSQNVLKKIKAFKSLSVFVAGTDLFLLTNYSGADPNVNGVTPGAGGSGGGGFDYGTLSTPRVLSFGLNVGF